jgi:ATP synthase F1 delta subunit
VLKAPQLWGAPGRLSNGLFEVAKENKAVDAVSKDLKSIKAMFNSGLLKDELHNAATSTADKEAMIKVLGKEAKFHELSTELLLTVLQAKELDNFQEIQDGFFGLVAFDAKIVTGTITSAVSLTSAQKSAVEKKIKAWTPEGATVALTYKEDATILGGLQVELGDQYQDLSVRAQIDSLATDLSGVSFAAEAAK